MESTKPLTDVKTSRHAIRYFFVGVAVTIFNYALYAVLANLIIKNNNFLWLSNLIATAITTIVAFIAHSKITWKERYVAKTSIIRFFIWNALIAIIISPIFTQLFSFLTPLYELAFNITNALHLPFSYDFVLTTGAFVLTSFVIMILNFLFYDKFVFPKFIYTESESDIKSSPKTKISIIIPIYNTAKYLPKCLDSVLNQTHNNLEIILIDDGSTDNSGKIADEYAKKDQRIKVIHQKNAGQSAARNAGLKKATGKFINFIDSDDFIANDFIKKLLQPYLNNQKTSLSICGLRYNWLKTKTHKDVFIDPLRPRKKSESKKAYILYMLAVDGRLYSSVNKLYKKEYLKNTFFDETIVFAEDTKFVLNYIKNTPDRSDISFVLEPLYFYNYGTPTSSMQKTATVWENWQIQYRDLKTWLGKKPTLREKFWLHLIHLRWRISFIRSTRRAKP